MELIYSYTSAIGWRQELVGPNVDNDDDDDAKEKEENEWIK